MKHSIYTFFVISFLSIMIIGTNTSCEKEEKLAPDTTSTNTVATPTFSLNTWKVERNEVFINAITSRTLSTGGTNNTRTYSFSSTTNVNGQIKTALLYITFADSLNAPATGDYNLIGLPNTVPTGNQVYLLHSGNSSSGTFFGKPNGGIIHVDNNWGSITLTGNNLLGNTGTPTPSLSINLEYF